LFLKDATTTMTHKPNLKPRVMNCILINLER
jgi:hypothetical protein